MRYLCLLFGLVAWGCIAAFPLRAGDPYNPRCTPTPTPTPRYSTVWTPDVQTLAKHLDDLHNQVEEWGTVSVSSLVLAPPETTVNVMVPSRNPDGSIVKDGSTTQMEPAQKYVRDAKGNLVQDKGTGKYLQEPLTTKAGTFEFKLQKSGSDYFDLAGYGEGTVQNSSRTFQQFAGSAAVQLYPDEAAAVNNQRQEFLRQQSISDQIENANLQLFQANVATAQQSQQFNITTAQTNLDEANQSLQKARRQQAKAQSAANTAQLELEQATDELTKAQTRQDQASTPGGPTPSPEDTAKLAKEVLKVKGNQAIAQTAVNSANADLANANTNLTTATQAQTTAQSQLATAMSAPLTQPGTTGLPAGTSQTTAGSSYPGVAAPASTPAPGAGFAGAAPPAAAPTDLNFGTAALANTLLPAGSAAFPARSRVIDAASSKATQEILNFLADPAAAAAFRDKTVMFAVGDISVNPGWRTKRDYAADLDISFSYVWKDAHAETIKRLVRSSYYTLALRRQVAQSYPQLMEAEDWDFLAAQEQQRYQLERALTRAREDADATHQAVAVAEGELLTAMKTLLDLARSASKNPVNDAQDRLQDAVKAFDTATDEVTLSNASKSHNSGTDQIASRQYALEKARENRDVAAADVVTAAKALAEKPVAPSQPAGAVAVPPAPPPTVVAGASPPPLATPAPAAPATPAPAVAGDPMYRDLEKAAKDAEKKVDALKTARTAADKAEKARTDALANQRSSGLEQSNQVVYDTLPCKTAADPLVAAVSPMTDNQNLDESSSIARQDDIALFLSLTLARAGLREQASAYERYVKQRRQDVATRSAIATANSYTLSGDHVGFQIGPRLRALAQPVNRNSAPAQTLDRQTFPALFLIGVTTDDLRPVLQRNRNGSVKVCERGLTVRFSHRWYRTDHVFWPPWHNKRQSLPSEKLAREARLEDFGNYLQRKKDDDDKMVKLGYKATPPPSTVDDEAHQEYSTLSSSYFGSNINQRIPGYFLVPDRLVQADPAPTDTASPNPAPTPKPVADTLPVISSATAPPAKGTGTAADHFTFTGKPTPQSPASFSVLLQGKNLDALNLDGAVCAPISGNGVTPGIHTVSTPTAIGAEGISVTLETTSPGGAFTILFPVKSDKEHADVAKLMTQVPSGTLNYLYTP